MGSGIGTLNRVFYVVVLETKIFVPPENTITLALFEASASQK